MAGRTFTGPTWLFMKATLEGVFMAETREHYEEELGVLENLIRDQIAGPEYPDVTAPASKRLITRVRYFLSEPYVFKEINGGWRIGAKNHPLTIKTTASEGFKYAKEVMRLNPVFIPDKFPNDIYAFVVYNRVHGWPSSNEEVSGMTPQERENHGINLIVQSGLRSLSHDEIKEKDRLFKQFNQIKGKLENQILTADQKEQLLEDRGAIGKRLADLVDKDGILRPQVRDVGSQEGKAMDNVRKGIKNMINIIRDDSDSPDTGKKIADFIEARITPLKNPLCYTPRAGDPPWEF